LNKSGLAGSLLKKYLYLSSNVVPSREVSIVSILPAHKYNLNGAHFPMLTTSRFELLQQKKEISHDQPALKHSEHNMVNFQKETTSQYI
jgi:hypothetical protein